MTATRDATRTQIAQRGLRPHPKNSTAEDAKDAEDEQEWRREDRCRGGSGFGVRGSGFGVRDSGVGSRGSGFGNRVRHSQFAIRNYGDSGSGIWGPHSQFAIRNCGDSGSGIRGPHSQFARVPHFWRRAMAAPKVCRISHFRPNYGEPSRAIEDALQSRERRVSPSADRQPSTAFAGTASETTRAMRAAAFHPRRFSAFPYEIGLSPRNSNRRVSRPRDTGRIRGSSRQCDNGLADS
jgi:hypothetical protein